MFNEETQLNMDKIPLNIRKLGTQNILFIMWINLVGISRKKNTLLTLTTFVALFALNVITILIKWLLIPKHFIDYHSSKVVFYFRIFWKEPFQTITAEELNWSCFILFKIRQLSIGFTIRKIFFNISFISRAQKANALDQSETLQLSWIKYH